jgi:LmbE family N-acetylglucosaminyl deacetylase
MAATSGKLAISANTRLMVIAPHPDDETIATGLLVQQVRAAGGEVRIVLLTGGDNNPWPQRWLERRWRIRAGDRQRWARRRRQELHDALTRLGIPSSGLLALGWHDLGVTDLLLQSTDSAVAAVLEAIDSFHPDMIALPALQDRHPDHSAAHVLVRLALARHPLPPRLLSYLVHGPEEASHFIEVIPAPGQLSTKHAALQAHRSQVALSGKRLSRLADRPERYAIPGDGSPAQVGLPWQPPRWLRPWLRLSVIDPAGAHHWAWADAPLRRSANGAFQLSPPGHESAAPRFAKLSLGVASPWIFDHWGWCELQSAEQSSANPVA